jgi:DNA-binding CsgD family transcriptional regulator
MRKVAPRRLLGREHELATLATAEGVILIEGAAGVGKTALLAETAREAQACGKRVLRARGAQVESSLPFGVVRQLFLPVMEGLGVAERDKAFAGAAGLARSVLGVEGRVEPFAAMHGLYWLCAHLAEREPLLLQVDDAHWADESSLAWLAHIGGRLEGIAVVIQVATRAHEGSALPPSALAQLAAQSGTEVLPLSPLSTESTAALVREALGGEVSDSVCLACHSATGGNAFYLRELLSVAAEESLTQADDAGERIAGLVPDRVRRAVLLRLGRQGEAAVSLARALAVLGSDVPVGRVAALAGVEVEGASLLADRLAELGIFADGRPLNFAHPIVLGAVRADMTRGSAARAHRYAVRVLKQEGADPAEIGVHALAAEATGDPELIAALRAAARIALDRGSPAAAVQLLRRALAEPASRDTLPGVLAELAVAGRRAGSPSAIADLERAIELTDDASERRRLELRLARWLFERAEGRLDHAVELYDRHGVAGEALAAAHQAGRSDLAARTAALRDTAAPDTDVLSALAYIDAFGLTSGAEAGAAAAALTDGWIDRGGEPPRLWAQLTPALICTERFDAFDRFIDRLMTLAQARGSLPFVAALCAFRAVALVRRGALAEAIADAATALETSEDLLVAHPATAALAEALTLTGRLDEAGTVLASVGAYPDRARPHFAAPQLAAARLLLVQQRYDEALAVIERCGSICRTLGIGPGWVPWQATRALILQRRGDHEAMRAGREALDAARAYGTPGCVGHALRCAALTSPAPDREAGLRDAIDVLGASAFRPELANALIDLGAHLRRAGHRVKSREPLARGLDVAVRCGATAIASRAREELLASGARPRRDMITGRDALTPSELRVARLAASGSSNTEIAQALFVTTKTVETHLGRAFRKLNIGRRSELDEALEHAEISVN